MRPWVVALSLVACGGGSAPKKAPVEPVKPVVREEPPPPAPPPEREPVILHAKAEMAPTKGSKLEPFVVGFMQREGDNALVLADLPVGVKAGTYHYVIHDGADCAKPGAPWAETKDVMLKLVVLPDLTGALENTELAVHLDGEQALVEHTLVLHEDKRGKPGKAVACGTIKASDGAP
jgi:hypothetical protein